MAECFSYEPLFHHAIVFIVSEASEGLKYVWLGLGNFLNFQKIENFLSLHGTDLNTSNSSTYGQMLQNRSKWLLLSLL